MYAVNLVNLPGNSVRRPEEHCGLAYIHALLTFNGIPAQITDAYANNIGIDECYQLIDNWLLSNKNAIVGFSPYVTTYDNMLLIAQKIKEQHPTTKIIAGGHFATLNSEYLLDKHEWLDAIIIGEGEYTALEYAKDPEKPQIAGLLRRGCKFTPRERIINLDELPFQTRYLPLEKMNGQPFSLSTSRGCNGACTFCSISTFYHRNKGPIYCSRSAQSVVDEIEMLVNKYNVRAFKIVDDNFIRINDKDNLFLKEFVGLIKQKNLNLLFRLSLRPDAINEETCILLKQFGAEVVAIGGESSSIDSLNLYNKKITPKDTQVAIDLLKKHNIVCLLNFINFDPIIDLNGLRSNYEFILENIDGCVMHRINSHLWVRTTDPIAKTLQNMDLAYMVDFPYLQYRYKYKEIGEIKEFFDIWCNHNMSEYYSVVDELMAPGEEINEGLFNRYKRFLAEDLKVLDEILSAYESGQSLDKQHVYRLIEKTG